MKTILLTFAIFVSLCCGLLSATPDSKRDGYVFSMNCKADAAVDALSTPEGRVEAIEAFRECDIDKVYVESYRSRIFVSEELLKAIKSDFVAAGFEVQCCVVPTMLSDRPSTGWDRVTCFTDPAGHRRLEEIVRRSASLFDEILFDDFLFTDCACEECKRQKGDKGWSVFRSELIAQVVSEYLIKPAREVNPDVKLIIKYPCWYDGFRGGGYDLPRSLELFDGTWAGTETRDLTPRVPQMQAFWLQNWMVRMGKCGGGWFDPLQTTPTTFVEQARNTILGGAPETLLHCYDYIYIGHRSVAADAGGSSVPKDRSVAEAFIREKKDLRRFAELISGMKLKGYALPKRPNFDQSGLEHRIHGFFPMMGIPCYAETQLPEGKPTIFCAHSAAFDEFEARLEEAASKNLCCLITNGTVKHPGERKIPAIVQEMSAEVGNTPSPCFARRDNLYLVRFDKPWDLQKLPELNRLRNGLLKPWSMEMDAPFGVSLTMLESEIKQIEVLQNFNDEPARVRIAFRDGKSRQKFVSLPDADAASVKEGHNKNEYLVELKPRSFLCFESTK